MDAQKKLVPRFATHVTGASYWHGAHPSVDEVAARLMRGESVKVFGLRRIGKSSLLAETVRQLKARHRVVIWHDLQKVTSIPGLLQVIDRSLREDAGMLSRLTAWYEATPLPPAIKAKATALFEQRILGTSEPGLDAYIEVLFEEIGKVLGAIRPEARPILVLDELPFFCLNLLQGLTGEKRSAMVSRLNTLLAILRGWRAEETGVAMAFGGSVSMYWLEREYGILTDHVNDCAALAVHPMSRDESVAMIRAMIAYVEPGGWSEDVAEALCGLLPAFYPGVLQYAFQQIRDLPDLSGSGLAPIYRERIADGLEANYHTQFNKRFARYTQSERVAARDLFDAILARPGEIVPWNDALALCTAKDDGRIARELIDYLVDDGFLLAGRTSGVRFASGLTRAWHNGPEC